MYIAFAIDGDEFEIIALTEDWDMATEAVRAANGGYDENEHIVLEPMGDGRWRGEGTGISLDFEIREVPIP